MKTALLSLMSAVLLISPGDAEPTNNEQYMLELINRARANGNTEAARVGVGTVNSGSPAIFGQAWTIQPAAPPVVWNDQLATAARNHAQRLFNDNWLGATDPHNYQGTTPQSRVAAAGFTMCTNCPQQMTSGGAIPGIENLGFAGSGAAYTPAQLITETGNIHSLLFVDSNTAGRLHRITIMHTWFREVGAGMITGTIGGQGRIYFLMDFGRAAGNQLFLTGVIYNDTVTANQFYTPGEGLGGIKVQAWQNGGLVAETTTYASGGYRLPLAAGAYQIKLMNAAGGVQEKGTVNLTTDNVKLDGITPVFTTPPVHSSLSLQIRQSGNTVVISWSDATYSLAAAASLTGPWTVVAPTSPATINIQPGKLFFRGEK